MLFSFYNDRIIAIVHIVLGALTGVYALTAFNLSNIISAAITIILGTVLLIGVNKRNTTAIKVKHNPRLFMKG